MGKPKGWGGSCGWGANWGVTGLLVFKGGVVGLPELLSELSMRVLPRPLELKWGESMNLGPPRLSVL